MSFTESIMASASLIISSTDSGGVVKLIRPADLVDSGVGVLKPLQQWIRDKVNERKMTPLPNTMPRHCNAAPDND